MRSGIKPNNLQLKKRNIFQRKRQWLTLALSLLGITLFWHGYRQLNLEPSTADLPDYATRMKRADWSEYTNIGRALSELTKGWTFPNPSFSDELIRDFEQRISKESIEAQTGRIKMLFAEEEAFRKADLEKSLEAYRYKLNQETARELDIKLNHLQTKYQKEISNFEQNYKKIISEYNEELDAKYQVTLANLQLQLLLIDLSTRIKDPQLEKQKIQDRIDKIHQEMNDKLTIRQRQLHEELDQYKKQSRLSLDAEIAIIRDQLTQAAEITFNKYRNLLEADFYEWREQRKQDIQMVINLRQSRL